VPPGSPASQYHDKAATGIVHFSVIQLRYYFIKAALRKKM
jgi:hypothetical protein